MTGRAHRQIVSVSLLLLATGIGLFLRLFHIAHSSIWHDEGFSVMLATRTPVAIWQAATRDVHPPLYYEVLHLWMRLFGTSELALRSLSVACGIALIPLCFLLVRRIASQRAAIITSFLVATSPFLVRYSQETRMYAMVTLWIVISLLAMVYIVSKPKKIWPYLLYTLSITLGLYTHYYAALVIMVYWLYLISLWWPHRKSHIQVSHIITSMRWWVSNIVAVILFAPWVATLIAQFRRGQGLSWLPHTTINTFHDSIWQFFTFTDAHRLPSIFYWLLPLLLALVAVYISQFNQDRHHYARLITWYSFVPIVLAIMVSVVRPVFHERYFSFTVVGFLIMLALAIDQVMKKRIWPGAILLTGVVLTQLIGVRNVYSQSNHQVRTTINSINTQYQRGDYLISGELYTYFDGSYYLNSSVPLLLYTGVYAPNGYGESSLLYDKNVYIHDYSEVSKGSRVWLIGKTSGSEYFEKVPANWQLVHTYHAGYSEVRLYLVQ